MKAVRYYGKEDVRLDDIPEPEFRPGTVKIAPAYTGICGSDLHLYFDGIMPPAPSATEPHPLSGETLPVVFGHEFSGVVEEIGEGVEGLTVGESVVVEPLMVCGECAACKAGRYNACEEMGFIGISGLGGGLSEHIVVEKRWVHPVGDLPLDQAALIEPLSVSAHAVRLSGAKAGDVAVVGGAGPIGLFTAAVLRAEGVTVIISEISEARRAKAVETGVADHVVDPSAEDLVATVLELTGGAGADVAFECAGVQPVFDALASSLRVGGMLQVVALFAHNPELPITPLLFHEILVQGTIGYENDHPHAIELARSGKLDLAPFITRRITADRIVEDGYEFLNANKDSQVKVLVSMK